MSGDGPFLIRGLGFSLEDVAYANKVVALIAALVGVVLGGALMLRWGLFKSLMVFGIFQAVSNLGYNSLLTQLNLGVGSAISVLIFLMVALIAFVFIKLLGTSVQQEDT